MRERESELDFSGFCCYDDEDDCSYEEDDSESDGESEGDSPVRRVGRGAVRRRVAARQRRERGEGGAELWESGEVGGELRTAREEGDVHMGDDDVEMHSGGDASEHSGDADDERPSRGEGGIGRRRARTRARRRGRGRRAPPTESRSRSPHGHGSDDGWSEDPTPPTMHPFTAVSGLTVPLPATPLQFLQLFLTKELLVYLVAETVDYAHYMRFEAGMTLSYRWSGCTLTDMAQYLGLVIFFGLLPAPNVRAYWRRFFFMATPRVPALMTRDRFLALDRYFHAFNRRAIPRGHEDRLVLVRPVMEYIRKRCSEVVVPTKNLSLDEGMMPYKGRLSIKVYNPKKPKKYGVKLFFITESTTGYVLDFSVYAGVFSTLRDTVFGLVDRYRNQGYHLFMDNYYNSVSLAQELYEAGIHCSGTLRLVRGAPTVLKNIGQNPNALPRGEMIFRRKRDVFVILWKGVRMVPMITTSHAAITEEHVEKRKTRRQGQVRYEEVTVQRPTVVGHYNRHMGGVDLFDQLVQYYSFARRSRRWTHKLNKYMLQLALQNAFTLYCVYSEDQKKLNHAQFIEMAAEALVNFKEEDWPECGSGPIPREPNLPREQRADRERIEQFHRRRGTVPPPSPPPPPTPPPPAAEEELVDDPAPAPPSPPEAVAGPSQDPDAPAAPAVPGSPGDIPPAVAPRPSRRLVDPVIRLQPGDHTMVRLPGNKQKRCRVCYMSGMRRDSRFICQDCNVALCRIRVSDCYNRYHTQAVYWEAPPRGTAAGRQARASAQQM